MHVWYTGTLLTGIHYGTGQRTADISLMDSVHAMRVSFDSLKTMQTSILTQSSVLVALLSFVFCYYYLR